LLAQEGPDISYSHRSFQEYFTAIFILSSRELDFSDLYELIEGRVATDEVVPMMYGLDKDYLLSNFVKPNLKLILNEVETSDSHANYVFLSMVYSDLVIWREDQSLKERKERIEVKGKVFGTSSSTGGLGSVSHTISFSTGPTGAVMGLCFHWFEGYDEFNRSSADRRFSQTIHYSRSNYSFNLLRYIDLEKLCRGLAYDSYNLKGLEKRISANSHIGNYVKFEQNRLSKILVDIEEMESRRSTAAENLLFTAKKK